MDPSKDKYDAPRAEVTGSPVEEDEGRLLHGELEAGAPLRGVVEDDGTGRLTPPYMDVNSRRGADRGCVSPTPSGRMMSRRNSLGSGDSLHLAGLPADLLFQLELKKLEAQKEADEIERW